MNETGVENMDDVTEKMLAIYKAKPSELDVLQPYLTKENLDRIWIAMEDLYENTHKYGPGIDCTCDGCLKYWQLDSLYFVVKKYENHL